MSEAEMNGAGQSQAIARTTRALADALLARNWTLALAESCTGGGIAAACTDLAGSSRWFERGFVTYSNAAKQELLGVSADTLHAHGAVSEATVREMAVGALQHSHADLALSVSGIAGPDGGSAQKPVGTVWFALAWTGEGDLRVEARRAQFAGDRAAVRQQAVAYALGWLLSVAG